MVGVLSEAYRTLYFLLAYPSLANSRGVAIGVFSACGDSTSRLGVRLARAMSWTLAVLPPHDPGCGI